MGLKQLDRGPRAVPDKFFQHKPCDGSRQAGRGQAGGHGQAVVGQGQAGSREGGR